MNARERLLNALTLKPVDRPPVSGLITSITLEVMKKTGVQDPEFHKNPRDMAAIAGGCYEILGLENVKIPFGMTVEAGALGAEIFYGEFFPQVKEKLAEKVFEQEVNLENAGQVPVLLEAIRILKEKYRGEVAVCAAIVGPLSMLGMLMGFNKTFLTMMDEPEVFRGWMDFTTNVGIQHAKLLIQAGADIIQIGEAGASGDLIGPQVYRDFVLPCHQKVCAAITVPSLMHICGKNSRNLEYIKDTGMDAFSFDEKTDIADIVKHLKGKTALVGYVPTELLLNGTPEEVHAYSKKCLAEGVDVLNAACTLSPRTPTENVKAMVSAVKPS
jgi:MtaA/CmuA family methyltransferase